VPLVYMLVVVIARHNLKIFWPHASTLTDDLTTLTLHNEMSHLSSLPLGGHSA
jgi:hypothetical protein